MSKLLINDNPLMVIPSLAVRIGMNEAVVLQQIHYWLQLSSNEKEGKKWVYNSYKEWQAQFPFWSESTIKRVINSLEKQGYLQSANFNQSKMDKTKWYTINYEILGETENQIDPSTDQNEPLSESTCSIDEGELTKAIPEITTETSSDKIIPYADIIDYLNQKINASYKSTTKKTKEYIEARWKEGFRINDFKKVIDQKSDEWLFDPHWCKYLRPETLFGPKFESYLNQKGGKQKWREEDFDLHD
ncbi:replication protein [Heyndrickxia sporothermodurans]|uniref:conserved phage C-terminal domain-containing protein n=1 Tax=Heyndrickxia sporothermodurans TaxID=46224 RepID=UPI000D384C10|nr:conserved phage C-terminal domain-containing protein [Heyndrickxia sporothermodurans]PTY76826.1 replication protein [Heyndrickxia sporothermodurans]